MSVKFISGDGKEIDIKKDMKWVTLPDGSSALESPSKAIPRILKKKYPEYYKEYQKKINENKKKLHNIHLKIKR